MTSQGQGKEARRSEGEKPGGEKGRSGIRTAAEWVSLAISALLILGIAAFQVWEMRKAESPFQPSSVRVHAEQARRAGAQWVLPVEVRNQGTRTLHDLKVEISYRGPEDREESREMTIDYLGEGSTTRLFFYFEEDPRTLSVEARALSYQTE